VQAESAQDRQAISALADEEANKAFYLRIVDGFADLGRRQAKAACLLHGDLGLDNVLVDHDRVIALIDAGWFVSGDPLMDVAYTMNSRIAEGEGMRGLVEGYGLPGLDRRPDVMLLRQYHWIGKLIYFHSVGQRDKYEQRRQVLLDFALANGFRAGA
jgi:aminoglycoside phosphotransferase (APT) family kinase protein